MPLDEVDPETRALSGSIEEIRNSLSSRIKSRELLDLLHHWRIKFAGELFRLSEEKQRNFEEKLRSAKITKGAGVYLIFVVNPKGNVMLYAGRTSGKSITSGLEFRVRDHIRLLGKTPLTLFIPNWWVKRIHTMTIEDKEKAKSLEKNLWMFLDENVKNKSRFNSLSELEKQLEKVIREYVKAPDEIRTVELQPNLNPKQYFLLESPPAGRPRGLTRGR